VTTSSCSSPNCSTAATNRSANPAVFAATGDPGWPVYRNGEPDHTRLFGGATAMTTEPPPDAVTAEWAAR